MQTTDIEMPDEQAARLDRFAMSVHKSPREATAQLIEEGLRHAEFPAVEFRDSDSGRQAYVVGASLAVWEVAMIYESHGHSAEQTPAHLRWPLSRVAALQENRSVSPTDLQRSLPNSRWT
jgi:hypothetical protein